MTALIIGSTRLADELVMVFEHTDPDYVHMPEPDGGPEASAAALRTTAVDAVINAAQPYATELTADVAATCAAAGLPLLRALPPSLACIAGSARWQWVDSFAAAGRAARDCHGDVLVALHPLKLAPRLGDLGGRPAGIHRRRRPSEPALPGWAREPGRTRYGLGGARATIDERGAQLLIAADSGDEDTGYFLQAAGARGLQVVMVRRPDAEGSVVGALAASAWLKSLHSINSTREAGS